MPFPGSTDTQPFLETAQFCHMDSHTIIYVCTCHNVRVAVGGVHVLYSFGSFAVFPRQILKLRDIIAFFHIIVNGFLKVCEIFTRRDAALRKNISLSLCNIPKIFNLLQKAIAL
jgi:hypothetical protein